MNEIEDGILSLGQMPYRCSARRKGAYANKRYRQLFIENYAINYRVDGKQKQIIVVTVRYSKSRF